MEAGRAGAGLGWVLPRPGLWSGTLVSPPAEEQAFFANPGVARSSSSEGLARAPGLSSEASLESNEVTLPCPPLPSLPSVVGRLMAQPGERGWQAVSEAPGAPWGRGGRQGFGQGSDLPVSPGGEGVWMRPDTSGRAGSGAWRGQLRATVNTHFSPRIRIMCGEARFANKLKVT